MPAAIRDLRRHDSLWPRRWRDLRDPPRRITIAGDPCVLGQRCVAVVGTRRATARGLAVAERLATELAALGWVVVSGLALGVDAAAHRGALNGGGPTVGVMATGIDRTYPARHRRLRRRIESQGCVLTEFPAGAEPRRGYFPRRNRLIAGLAEGVVVVEAPRRSGALLTAFMALDLGREVFAVPGPVDREEYRGCHHLLRLGATLVETAADISSAMGLPDPRGEAAKRSVPVYPEPLAGSPARWIWDRLDLDGVARDELRRRWDGTTAAWSEGLLALEIAGLIRRLPGGRIARTIWNP